jgi:hypothetical protein
MTRCYKKSDDKTAAATDGSNKKKLTIANELKTAFATNLCVSEEDIEKIICQGQRPGKLSARERELAGAFHRLGMQPLLFTWCSPKWRISVIPMKLGGRLSATFQCTNSFIARFKTHLSTFGTISHGLSPSALCSAQHFGTGHSC